MTKKSNTTSIITLNLCYTTLLIIITFVPLMIVSSSTPSGFVTTDELRYMNGKRMTNSNLNETLWEKGSPLAINDTGHAHAYKGEIYFVGGSAVQKYNPSTEKWTVIKEEGLGYSPYAGGSALIGDRIYMVHGWTTKSVTYYDISSNSLSSFSYPETMRLDVGVAAVDGILYVSGGWLNGIPTSITTVEAYNPTSDDWYTVKSMSTGRKAHEMVAAGGFLYVIGGNIGRGWFNGTNSVERYNASTDEWEYIDDVPSFYKECGSTNFHNGSIIITSVRSKTHIFNSSENKWVQGPSYSETADIDYWANSLVFLNGKVYSIGMRDSPGKYYNSTWVAKIPEPKNQTTDQTTNTIIRQLTPGFDHILPLFSLIILTVFMKKHLNFRKKAI